MDLKLRIIALVAGLLVFGGVFMSLINRKINESISFFWLIIGVVSLAGGIFPQGLDYIAALFGIAYPPSIIFVAAIIILLLIVYSNSSQISLMNSKLRELSMQISILKSEQKITDNSTDENA